MGLQTHAAETRRGDREHRPLVSPLTAYWITDVLSDDSAREYIFGRGGSLEFPFPVAVKTGQPRRRITTTGPSAIPGTSPSAFGSATSIAHRSSRRRGLPGAPIFHAVMLAATERLHGAAGFDARAIVAVPDGIVQREVCAPPACRRTLVPGAPARTVATGQRSALQLASLERRRAARHLAAGTASGRGRTV